MKTHSHAFISNWLGLLSGNIRFELTSPVELARLTGQMAASTTFEAHFGRISYNIET